MYLKSSHTVFCGTFIEIWINSLPLQKRLENFYDYLPKIMVGRGNDFESTIK